MIYILLLVVVLGFVASRFKRATNYSQYPSGPLSFPFIGSILSLGLLPHERLSLWKKKYGNIIAIDFGNVRGIVLNDFNTIKQGFTLKEVQNRPASEAFSIVRGKIPTGIGFSSGRTNEEQKAFAVKMLKYFGMGKNSIECLLTEELQRLFSTFDKQLDTPIVNKELFQLTAVSVIWNLMTGEHGKAEDLEFINLMQKIAKVGRGFNIFTLFFPHFAKLFPKLSGWNDFVTGFVEMDECAYKSIDAHKKTFKTNAEPKDLIEAYLQKIESTQNEDSTFFGITGDVNLKSVVSDFLGAGTEALSSIFSWFLAVFVYFPEVQEKIYLEIDRVIGRIKLPSLEDRHKLPYMESVILETLRFSSFFPLGVPHATSEDVKIDDYIIPKGTVVFANAYAALHDPTLWKEPNGFKPERFLTEGGLYIDRNIARNVDIIFGHGKRICPGEKLAKDQLFIFITGLCQRYLFLQDPLCKYGQKIQTEIAIMVLPRSHSLIIRKR